MADSFNELFGLGSHSADANLLGWWPCQDDAASTTVVDESGNGDDGTLNSLGNSSDISTTGPNSWLTKAFALPGSSGDYIDIPATPFDSVSGPKTLMARVNRSASASSFKFAFGSDSGSERNYLGADDTNFFVRWGNGSDITTSVTDGVWKSLAGSISAASSATGRINLDGSDQSSSGSQASSSSNNLSIAANGSGSNGWHGDLCDCSVWDRELTEAEMAQWHNGPEPVNTVAPAVTGTETEDETLSCTTGTWGIDSPFSSGSNGTVTYTYQWTRSDNASGLNEADIIGATSSTYTLVTADVGKYIRCRVAASNDGGNDSDADTNSNMTGAISAAGASVAAPFQRHYLGGASL